jgi:hypothetical protein
LQSAYLFLVAVGASILCQKLENLFPIITHFLFALKIIDRFTLNILLEGLLQVCKFIASDFGFQTKVF